MVVKIGGSLMYTSRFDINGATLAKIKGWYVKNKEKIDNIVLVTGGGKLSRELGGQVKEQTKADSLVHNVAMEATQVNSHILKAYIGDNEVYVPAKLGDAYEYLIDNDSKKRFMISGGLKCGWSTDMDAAVFADILKEKIFYKLSDVEGVYTKDPNEYSNAEMIKDISWKDYMKMFHISAKTDHKPNMHIPISSETAIFCEAKGVSVFVSGGRNIRDNADISNVFETGTLIHP